MTRAPTFRLMVATGFRDPQDLSPDMIMQLAAAAQQRLTHPVAEAIVHAARGRELEIPEREGLVG